MNFKNFILEFKNRAGIPVVFSAVVEKTGGFLLVLISTHFITKESYGLIVYANTALVFLFPFIGFGIHQSLLRFGSLNGSQLKKKKLFNYTFRKGIKYSAALILFVILLSPIITSNLKSSKIYLIILSIQLISLFVYEMIRIYSRLIHLNKLYAEITILKTIFIVLITYVLTINYGAIGYVISLALAPLIISFFYLYKIKLINRTSSYDLDVKFKEYIKYGLFTSLAGVLSELLYAVDVLLIANILKNEQDVAQYKISNIIPFSLLFLSVAFIKTNFVKIASKSENDKLYIKNYYINYLKIFGVISLLILMIIPIFSNQILSIFGSNYSNDNNLITIFTIGVVGALLFRIPLGNIISAIGWAKINTLNSLIILFLNVILSYFFIKNYGIIGAAIVTAFLMWLSGIFSLIAFIWYLKNDNKRLAIK